MSAHSPLWMGIAACLLFLGMLPVKAKEEATFYFLAIPVAQDDVVCLEVFQFDRAGKPVMDAKKKPPFFTIWRSGYWAEKSPDIVVKDMDDWRKALELRAQKTVASKKEMAGLPPAIVDFFVAVETLRAGALNGALVVQPLFQAKGFVGWGEVSHLNVIAMPDTLGPQERSKALLRTFKAPAKEVDQEPGQWMKTFLENLGVKVKSSRYWPEYNVFLFEGGADFKDLVDALFNAIAKEQSRLPAAPVCGIFSKP